MLADIDLACFHFNYLQTLALLHFHSASWVARWSVRRHGGIHSLSSVERSRTRSWSSASEWRRARTTSSPQKNSGLQMSVRRRNISRLVRPTRYFDIDSVPSNGNSAIRRSMFDLESDQGMSMACVNQVNYVDVCVDGHRQCRRLKAITLFIFHHLLNN